MTKKQPDPQKRLLSEYKNLNDERKKELREAFNKEFDYPIGGSSFWRKINNPTQLWGNERNFLATYFKKPINKLFPNPKKMEAQK